MNIRGVPCLSARWPHQGTNEGNLAEGTGAKNELPKKKKGHQVHMHVLKRKRNKVGCNKNQAEACERDR